MTSISSVYCYYRRSNVVYLPHDNILWLLFYINFRYSPSSDELEISSQLSAVTVSSAVVPSPPRIQSADNVEPLELVRKGRHVMISMKDGVPCVGTRLSTAFFQGYTFTKRPLQIGEKYLVQITKTSQLYVGSLSFGVTCCDPSTIGIGELPDDPNQLVDRREYWVMSRNVAEDTKPGDVLIFSINNNGT